MGIIGEEEQEVQTCSHKMNSCGDVKCSLRSIVKNTVISLW